MADELDCELCNRELLRLMEDEHFITALSMFAEQNPDTPPHVFVASVLTMHHFTGHPSKEETFVQVRQARRNRAARWN